MRAALATEGLPTADLCSARIRLYALEREDVVLGYAGLERHGRAAILRSVVTLPTQRGRGAGRRLVERMTAKAQELGIAELYLLTTTAAGFFGRLGFERIDRAGVPAEIAKSAEFAELCPTSAVCMARRLPRPQ
jgi:N-acetylglutamate synthase-like GNAT family acetyltransferase